MASLLTEFCNPQNMKAPCTQIFILIVSLNASLNWISNNHFLYCATPFTKLSCELSGNNVNWKRDSRQWLSLSNKPCSTTPCINPKKRWIYNSTSSTWIINMFRVVPKSTEINLYRIWHVKMYKCTQIKNVPSLQTCTDLYPKVPKLICTEFIMYKMYKMCRVPSCTEFDMYKTYKLKCTSVYR